MTASVLLNTRHDGTVDVIEAPPEALFSAELIENPPPFMAGSLSVHGDQIVLGSLMGRGAIYRITGRDERGITAELVTTVAPWAGA